jgi:tetratricopeptide (TPR) repeat protein
MSSPGRTRYTFRLWASLAAACLSTSAQAAPDTYLSTSAQAAPERITCPARGGNVWREYHSRHFVLDTDASPEAAAQLVERLEKIEAMVLKALLGEPVEIPGHARVLAFARPADFHALVGGGAGWIMWSSLEEPTIAIPLSLRDWEQEIVANEITHYLSRFVFPRKPAWFSEGLAAFMETIGNDESGRAPATGTHIVNGDRTRRAGVAGAIPRRFENVIMGRWVRGDGRLGQEHVENWVRDVSMKELLEWRGSGDDGQNSYHVWSWLLYHWLWNNRSKAFAAYESRLQNGDDPALAWDSSFPEFSPAVPAAMDRLRDSLESYRRSGRYATYRVEAQADYSFTEGSLSSADLHMLLLEVRRNWPQGKDEALALRRAEIEEALGEDPHQPFALVAQARLDGQPPPLEGLRSAVTARPSDWRAWYLLGALLPEEKDRAEQEADLRQAVKLNPDAPVVEDTLARLLVRTGRAHEALPFASRALDLAPWNPLIMGTLAAVATELGQCKEALVLERRAAAMAPRDASAESLRRGLNDIERRCGSSASADTH